MPDLPEVGEIVLCKVKKVLGYGVFVELVEYENVQGFVHISQVASSWIKNIRNFVKENQMRAGQVTRLDNSTGQIDISFSKIGPQREKEKINEWRLLKRQQKLIELIADEKKSDFDTAWEKVAEPLLVKYDNLVQAFEKITIEGESAVGDVPKDWVSVVVSVVRKNIPLPEKTVSGYLKIGSFEPDGVDDIKKALLEAKASAKDKNVIDLSYTGAGKYLMKATALDYKTAEKMINKAAEKAIAFMVGHKGTASFERI